MCTETDATKPPASPEDGDGVQETSDNHILTRLSAREIFTEMLI
jgi:hypothetical protein